MTNGKDLAVGGYHRKRMPSRWEVYPAKHTAQELWNGTDEFVLVRRDFELMALLFERNFTLTKHLTMYTSVKAASNRLARLLAEGVVARIPVPRMVGAEIKGRTYAYSLTTFGLECLIAGGHRDAMERRGAWSAPHLTASNRNSVLHDLAVGELCEGIVAHLRGSVSAGWKSSRYTVQKVNPIVAGGQSFTIVPDAAVVLATGDTALIEYEESLRPESFGSRLADYRRYFEHQLWKAEYIKAPVVLVSASETADRQRYWSRPFAEALSMAQAAIALYRYMYLISENSWRAGEWVVQPLSAGSERVPLREVLLGKVQS